MYTDVAADVAEVGAVDLDAIILAPSGSNKEQTFLPSEPTRLSLLPLSDAHLARSLPFCAAAAPARRCGWPCRGSARQPRLGLGGHDAHRGSVRSAAARPAAAAARLGPERAAEARLDSPAWGPAAAAPASGSPPCPAATDALP